MITEKGIRVIMATDGLWDILPISKIRHIIKRTSLKKCPPKLMNLISRVVQDGCSHDDVTILVLDIISKSVPDPNIDFKHMLKRKPVLILF